MEVGEELLELGHALRRDDIVVALVDEEGAGREAQQQQAEVSKAGVARQEQIFA